MKNRVWITTLASRTFKPQGAKEVKNLRWLNRELQGQNHLRYATLVHLIALPHGEGKVIIHMGSKRFIAHFCSFEVMHDWQKRKRFLKGVKRHYNVAVNLVKNLLRDL